MRIVIAAVVLTAIGCAYSQEQWRQDPTVLACSPASLSPGQILTLKLGPNHGGELAIRRLHDDQMFLLVVGSPPPGHFQLMSQDEFAAAGNVEIKSSTIATAWAANTKPEMVFSGPGEYEIAVSPNFESEIGGYVCRITFEAK